MNSRVQHPALLPEHRPVRRAFSDGTSDSVTRLIEIIAKGGTALTALWPH
jgi:hypothetical protein